MKLLARVSLHIGDCAGLGKGARSPTANAAVPWSSLPVPHAHRLLHMAMRKPRWAKDAEQP